MAGLAGFLKGADAVVLAAAKRLKLSANFLPIWKCSEYYSSDASGDSDDSWKTLSEDHDSDDDNDEDVIVDQEPFRGVLGNSFGAQMHVIYGRCLHHTRGSVAVT